MVLKSQRIEKVEKNFINFFDSLKEFRIKFLEIEPITKKLTAVIRRH